MSNFGCNAAVDSSVTKIRYKSEFNNPLTTALEIINTKSSLQSKAPIKGASIHSIIIDT